MSKVCENKLKNQNDVILSVENLHVEFNLDEGILRALNGMDIRLSRGKSIGIVGESGCGKTVTGHSILRILPPTADIVDGRILLQTRDGNEVDLARLNPEGREMRIIRGGDISIIFQEPMAAFSPVHTISNQITEAILLHEALTPKQARQKVVDLLNLVGIPNPIQRLNEYPFQLSGGMCQRAMIAMALACNPRILIADEPTTALDVTIQTQVMRLIKEMQAKSDLSLILITHDLGVVAHMVEHIYVTYLGRVVEDGPIRDVLRNPKHPYTAELLKSIPKLSSSRKHNRIYPITGTVPSPMDMPSGCAFHPRCPSVLGEICKTETPGITRVNSEHGVHCFLYK